MAFTQNILLQLRQPVQSGSREAATGVQRRRWVNNTFFVRRYSLSCFDLGFTHNQVWKTDLTWTPLLQKMMTKRTFLVFWQLSQWGRKSNSRLDSWKCGNIRTHFLYTNLSLIGHQMQKPTEKMLTDVQKEIASILSISANVKADNAGDSSTNSSPSFDI